jgi:hypothetical protein
LILRVGGFFTFYGIGKNGEIFDVTFACKIWQCSERYKVKGAMGCANRHVEEKTLVKAYLMAWNALVENRETSWNGGKSRCRARIC